MPVGNTLSSTPKSHRFSLLSPNDARSANNLKEAMDLYFEEEDASRHYQPIRETLMGELNIKIA